MTPKQIQLLQIARRQVGLDEERYRLLLKNVGGVDSCKDLTNEALEEVMAVLEDMGFVTTFHGVENKDYWREKIRRRGHFADDRVIFRLVEQSKNAVYPLAGMVLRAAGGRTDDPKKLHPYEAANLLEAYRPIHRRKGAEAAGYEPGSRPDKRSRDPRKRIKQALREGHNGH
jgi:hypothetical protein